MRMMTRCDCPCVLKPSQIYPASSPAIYVALREKGTFAKLQRCLSARCVGCWQDLIQVMQHSLRMPRVGKGPAAIAKSAPRDFKVHGKLSVTQIFLLTGMSDS